jgi:HK97 family phage major capsid protein
MTPQMRLKLPGVRRALEALPWAIERTKLEAMLELIELRANGGAFSAEEVRARIGDARRTAAAPHVGGVAVLPLYGVIAQRMDMLGEISGGTSTQRFADAFDAALADPAVGAIVLDIDSPGGSVGGTPELAARIFQARGQGTRIVACANTLMASAAYWIGAAADEIVASPSATVGSIGVFTVHVDQSQLDAAVGLTYSIISAGKYKTEGNPHEPLSPDAAQTLQDWVDEYYAMFVTAVAQYRGVSVADVRNGYGEGRALTAKAALAAGLVDRVATLAETIQRLGGGPVGLSGRSPSVPPGGRAAAPLPGLPLSGNLLSHNLPTPIRLVQTDTLGADGAAPSDHHPPESRPIAAKEQPVDIPTGAAPATPAAADITTALAADRARARAIRALAAEHQVPEATVQALVTNGASIDEAKAAILDHVQSARRAAPVVQVGADREEARPFASFGEQIRAVIGAGIPGGRVDPRLLGVNRQALASASGMNESVGSEGGFFVDPALLPGIIDPVYTEDPILSRVTRIPIGPGKNGVKYNVVDESARTTGNRWGGIQMHWSAEAETATASKPKLRQVQQDLKKLLGFAYLTDELLEDGPAAEALINRAFQAELAYMLAIAIFRGTGAGQPLGFQTSSALVTQAIEAGQTKANTNASIALNVTKMLSRVPASLWGDVIWLFNQELLPYLMTAVVGTGGAAVPVFMGAGGLSGKPYDTILGRPAYASELCEAVGTPGDLVCIAPSQYHLADKGGPNAAQSMHVRFLYDEMTLRITYRCDGQPVWKQAITPYKGATTRSPFVVLATRA